MKHLRTSPVTASEAGRRGGEVTFARHGRQHVSDMGHKGGSVTAKRGSAYYARIGRLSVVVRERQVAKARALLGDRADGLSFRELVAIGRAAEAADGGDRALPGSKAPPATTVRAFTKECAAMATRRGISLEKLIAQLRRLQRDPKS